MPQQVPAVKGQRLCRKCRLNPAQASREGACLFRVSILLTVDMGLTIEHMGGCANHGAREADPYQEK